MSKKTLTEAGFYSMKRFFEIKQSSCVPKRKGAEGISAPEACIRGLFTRRYFSESPVPSPLAGSEPGQHVYAFLLR